VLKEILEHLLGVRYTVPGGNEVLIEPPACRLEHARGSVPVGNGYVHASWRRRGGSVELECTVPPGSTVTVRLPAGTYGVKGPTADDAVVLSSPVGAPDGATRDFRVHPGTWTFTPGRPA
jgi:alpha-L-rhamnosidase